MIVLRHAAAKTQKKMPRTRFIKCSYDIKLQMNPEQQRIAIAEMCGWTEVRWIDNRAKPGVSQWLVGRPPSKGTTRNDVFIPDYLQDLNAMHEVEKVLQAQCKYWPDYVDELSRLVTYSYPHIPGQKLDINWSQTIHAAAGQRAEAFLKTLGLWKQEL